MSAPKSRPKKRLHWHPDAHYALSSSRLYFWFYRFATWSSREDVLKSLLNVAAELGITSYATYELMGAFDLLARFYMQPEKARDFQKACEDALDPYDLINNQPFRVEDTPRNWVWAGGPRRAGPLPKIKKEVLEQHYPQSQLELLNQVDNRSNERRRLVTRFTDLGLITHQAKTEGIKFVATIGTQHKPNVDTRRRLGQRLEKALDHASAVIRERSLYSGEFGQHQQFLVMCRIKEGNFHKIRSALLEPLGEAGVSADATTTTYTVISEDFVCFQDRLAVSKPYRPDPDALLRGHESGKLEVKASLTLPVDDWVKEGVPLNELKQSRSLPLQGVLKSVVALLNSGGGTVVVGALEEVPYSDEHEALERLGALPAVGEHRILGLIDPTYVNSGWDRWDRKLRSLMRSRIDPNPGVLVESREVRVAGRNICVIDIDDPGEEGEFFLKLGKENSVFFGREGTQVHAMSGSELKRHREQVAQHRKNEDPRR